MPRYGKSAEDFNRESAALEAAIKARKGVAAAEAQLTGALEESSAALERNVAATRLNRQAKQEAADYAQREQAVEARVVEGLNIETQALERVAAARRRAAQAGANLTPAVRGAGDPLFARAYGMADPTTGVSQYALRRELAIGQQRAAQLQAAIGTGFRPGDPQGRIGAATRAQAAQAGLIQADIDLAAAKKAYTNAINRGDAAAAEAAAADREAATAAKQASTRELESTNREAAARDTNAAVIEREIAQRERAFGTALVPRTRDVAGPDQGSLTGRFYGGAPGPTGQGPQYVPRQPVQEFPVALGGGSGAYDVRYETEAAKARSDAVAIQELTAARLADERAARLELNADVSAMFERQAAAEERATAATRFSAVELGTASQAMFRHGALTSEYIQAAVRGETTLRELGNQALVTAGKFTAWTVAATAIYGVAAALHEVGKGAIASASGVGQLQRFIPNINPEQAQQGFRDAAQFANVPINEVVDAQSQFARVYHNQHDSLQASRAALLATKLDNIKAADSFNYLTAGARGFNLSAKDMMPLLAQINALQNKLGARVSETVPAFGRSAAAIKNAGGDLNEFLAIIATMQRATGLSGLNINTILSRSATRFVHAPKNAAELRRFGLDPTESYTQLILDSVRKAQTLGPEDRRQLANALGGPQLGSRGFVGLLSRPDILRQALQALGDPRANQALLEHERQHVLGTPAEQIKTIGVNLSRLGSALGESGVGTPALAFLKTLNLTLDVAVKLVEVFDKIPDPLRSGLAIAVELYAVMRLIQRFGGNVPILRNLAGQSGNARLIQRGARDSTQAAIDERERLANQYNRATLAAQRGRVQAAGLREDYQAAERAGTLPPADSEERAAINRRILTAEAAVERQELRAAELELEINAARQQVLAEESMQRRLKEAQNREGAAGVVALARREGLYQPGAKDVPSSVGAVPAGTGGLPERERIGAATGLPMIVPAGVTDEEAGALAREQTAAVSRVDRMAAAMSSVGFSGRLLGTATEKTAAVVRGGGGALTRLGRNLSSLGTELKNAIGPLDVILLGGFALYEQINSAIDSANKADDVMAKYRLGQITPKQGLQQLPKRGLSDAYASFHNWIEDNIDRPLGGGAGDIETKAQAVRDILKADQRLVDARNKLVTNVQQDVQEMVAKIHSGATDTAQLPGASRAGALPLSGFPNVLGNLSQRVSPVRLQHPLSVRQQLVSVYRNAISNLQADIETARALGGAGAGGEITHAQTLIAQYQSQIRAAQAAPSDKSSQMWAQLTTTPKLFAARVKQDGDAISAYYNEWGKLRGSYGIPDLRAAYRAAEQQAHAHPTAGNLSNLATISQALQTIGQDIVSRYNDDIQSATNASQRADAYEHAIGAIHQLPHGRERTLATRQLQQASYQADQTARQTALAYSQSLTTDQSTQDAEAIQSAANGVREAAQRFGVGSDQWKAAMTLLNNARHTASQQVQQDVQGEIDSTNALITARASGDPSGRSEAIAAVTTAQRSLQGVLSDPTLKGKARANAIRNAQAAVISAQLAENNYFTQQASQITQARFQLKESQTDDPVKQAQIEVEAARAAIGQATDPAARIQAKADYNIKRRNLLQAKVQASEDNVDFDLEMGKITQAQAISQLQAILSMHNLTKKMRRDIQLKIHQLQQEADQNAQSFDLAVGAGIKLPTIYDVRRAIGSIRQAGDQGSRVVANNRIQVNVEVNDPHAAGKVYEALDQAMGTTIAANIRQSGVGL